MIPNLSSGRNFGIDVEINFVEKKRFYLKTGTEIGTSDANINASANIRNLFGQAESLQMQALRGTTTATACNALFMKPYHAQTLSVNINQQQQDYRQSSSHLLTCRSLATKLHVEFYLSCFI